MFGLKKAFLLADVGGTNVRFALLQGTEILSPVCYQNRHFATFASAVRSYLEQTKADVGAFIIGAAGIKKKNSIDLTNYNWKISTTALKKDFHLREVVLVNDFSLQGLGIIDRAETDFIPVGQQPMSRPDGTRAVIGAGTGLGVCFLIPEKENTWRVLESEGGHSSAGGVLSPGMHFLTALMEKRTKDVSFEQFISGPGLMLLYNLLTEKGKDMIWEEEKEDMKSAFGFLIKSHEDTAFSRSARITRPEEITELARQGDETALLCWWFFLKYLTVFCSDIAVLLKTTGGIYLVGDLFNNSFTQKLLEHFPFRKFFEKKGALTKYVQQIPVYLVPQKDIPLAGLQYIAMHIKDFV